IDNIKLKHENATIVLKAEKPVAILADEFHFTNIVYNLIDNSIKYCERDPEITIALAEENRILKISFIDNGIGVSGKELSFMFDKFYRIPNSKSNEVNGFGLGLYYVKKICTLHRWKISAAENKNPGLSITISIPQPD